jgi:hypothetical protein
VLDALMAEADGLCRAMALLTVHRSEVITEVASWYLHEFVEQCSGGAATPWRGPVDPDRPLGRLAA